MLILDGAMGSLLMKGNNDALTLTDPETIRDIHRRYVEAGADLLSTNTFCSQRISQREYHLEDRIAEMNRRAVELARSVNPRWVLGDVGPTSKMLSLSEDVTNPAARSITFDELEQNYIEQMEALMAAGVDAILVETSFDTLNVKAAISAYQKCRAKDEAYRKNADRLMLSFTISDASGRILSGQTIEAIVTSVAHAKPFSIGLNCGLGAEAMIPYLRRLKAAVKAEGLDSLISFHPNAGLPNQFGQYDQTPEIMATQLRPIVEEGLVDILGGCCGTTPEHIRAIRQMVDEVSVAVANLQIKGSDPSVCKKLTDSAVAGSSSGEVEGQREGLSLSGLESFNYNSQDFITVGERCNVAGSRKFLRLVNEKNYDEALEIARQQVKKGAMVIDVNMDDGLLDAREEMVTFLNLVASDPSICRVPIMIDSSRFDVIEAGLKCCQGKCIVNSISLKQGEEEFLAHARIIHRLGAAVIVMLFDEEGQATDYERRIRIAERAYRLLVDEVGFPPTDIIFDPNILTIATGMEEHKNYALDYIRAVEWIVKHLPGVRISGGLSNLSFAFRGNNTLREAMHSVFLHHATKVGMNMAIMNPATRVRYEDIEPELRELLSDVILNRRDDASERLIEKAQAIKAEEEAKKQLGEAKKEPSKPSVETTPEARLQQRLMEGNPLGIEVDLQLLIDRGDTPLQIISGPLMAGMNTVGTLFGEGKMFLPQVVKTARTMKMAVEFLEPFMTAGATDALTDAPLVLLATVKGDVHDIGKNIVGVVLGCNGFRVKDLGVMVPAETIVEEDQKEKVDFVCLSGLITPSLDEMAHVAEAMQKAGLRQPLLIGGATTSALHTAVKIAPLYEGGVFHMRHASENSVLCRRLMNPEEREQVLTENRLAQRRLRMVHRQRTAQLERSTELAAQNVKRPSLDWNNYTPVRPPFVGGQRMMEIMVSELLPLIDWVYFFHAWRVEEHSEQGELLKADALALLETLKEDKVRTLQAFYPARGKQDRIEVGMVQIMTPRQNPIQPNGQPRKECVALCDYVSPQGNDFIGLFSTTVSAEYQSRLEQLKESGSDDYELLLLQTLGDRLVEAAAEWLSRKLKSESGWGGIRPAVGYPSLPDQKEIFHMAQLLDFQNIGITLTENGAMYPQSSVSGIYISHPEARYFVM